MKKKNLRPLILSSLAAVAMAGVGTGATFALFTDKAETEIGVTAGKVKLNSAVTFKTYSAEANPNGDRVEENGAKYISKETAQPGVFTNGGTAAFNAEGLLELKAFTPGYRIVITVDPSNESDVAILYRFSYSVLNPSNDDSYMDLAKGLTTSIQEGEGEATSYIGLETYRSSWTKMSEDLLDNLVFDIELPIDAGNEFQNKNANIAIRLEAVQGNANVDEGEYVKSYDLSADSVYVDESEDTVVEATNEANDASVKVTIPAATTEVTNNSVLTLTVGEISKADNQVDQDYTDLSFDVSLKVDGNKVTSFSSPVAVEVNVGTGLGISSVTHNGNPVTDYTYDPSEGIVRFETSTFSPFVITYFDLPSEPIRIGKTGYNTLADAIAAAGVNDTIILQDNIQQTSNLTVNKPVSIDLDGHSLAFASQRNISVESSGRLAIRNGSCTFRKIIAMSNSSQVALERLNLDVYSSNLFQLYGKNTIDATISNCVITSHSSANNNNSCLISMTGGELADINIEIEKSVIHWNEDAWVKFHANAADHNVAVKFDDATLGDNATERVAYSSSAVPDVVKNIEDGMNVFSVVKTGSWAALVADLTEAPEGYEVDGNTVSISSPLGLAYFSKLSETDDFAGKTVRLTADIDLAFNQWTPISKLRGSGFAGTFDGQGHTISNMANKDAFLSSNSTKFGNGLFFRLGHGSVVQNLTINKALLGKGTSYRAIGAVTGYATGNVTMNNVHVQDSYIHGDMRIGGLVGMTEDPNGSIQFNNCSVENVTIEGYCNMGGFIGTMLGAATIDAESYVSGLQFEESYSIGSPYATFETTIEDEESKYIDNGAAITGRYHDYEGDGYYYGCSADFYIDYGGADCDPWLANGYRLANSEVTINGTRVVDGKTYLN